MTTLLERISGIPQYPFDGRVLVRREYLDGPRYVEALRGGRAMRERGAGLAGINSWDGSPFDPPQYTFRNELTRGIPEGWISRGDA